MTAIYIATKADNSDNNTSPEVSIESTETQQAEIYAELENSTLKTEELVNVSIFVDTGAEQVQTVAAHVSYPTDAFDFVGINTDESAFSIQAENKEMDGTIIIERGSFNTVSGKNLVAIIQLRAKSSSGTAELKFVDGTQVLSSKTYKNLLGSSPDVQITFEE